MSGRVERLERIWIQKGLWRQKTENEPGQELVKSEIEKLKDACLKMREEKVETLNADVSLNAFLVSLLSLILFVTSTVITLVNDNGSSMMVTGFFIFAIVVIAGIAAIFILFCVRARRNAIKADRYRDAYIWLSFMQDSKTGLLTSGEQVPQDNRIEVGSAVDQGAEQV